MNRKTKLLVIGAVPPPFHGVTVFTRDLLESHLASDFEIVHLDTSDHRTIDNIARVDITNVAIALKNLFRLSIMLLKEKPRIVYLPISVAFMPYIRDGSFIILAKMLSNARIVVHLHGGSYFRDGFLDRSNWLVHFFVKETLRLADVAVVLSPSLAWMFHGLIARVEVVPNGTRFDPCGKSDNRTTETREGVTIGFLGNLMKAKGFLDLLRGAATVVRLHPDARFVLAGPWWEQEPDNQRLAREMIDEYELGKHVSFLGEVSDEEKGAFFQQLDLFVFPSRSEGMPIVILEAMAAGCPVISTRKVGAISDVVQDGETGLLIDKGDHVQLASAINRLVADASLRTSMGAAGRRRFEKEYTWERCMQRLGDVFRNVT